MTRRLDRQGRVVLPRAIRKCLGLEPGTSLEFFIDTNDRKMVLQPYRPGCHFCGETEGLVQVGAGRICKECARRIAASAV